MAKKKNITINEVLGKGFTQQGDRLKYQRLVKEAGYEKQIAVYGKTYAECLKKFEEKEKTWRQAVILGNDLKTGHVKLHEGMTAYFQEHSKINGKKKAIKRSTNSTDLRVVRNQIEKYPIGSKYADKLTARDLQAHIEQLIKDGYSESIVKKTKDCLRAYYYDLYKSPANPAYSIVIPHFESTEKACNNIVEWQEILDDDEIIRFLKECDVPYIPKHRGTQYADLLKFLFYTYMRIGEACALQVKDYEKVNEAGYINISKNLSREGKNWYIDTPKYKASVRRIKLSKEAQAIIEKRIAGKLSTDLIWSQSNGDYVKYTSLENPLKKMLLRIDCQKDLSIHSLRHSGISFALRHGANISAVSKNSGHSSIAITQDIYQHVLSCERDKAVDITELALNALKEKYEKSA